MRKVFLSTRGLALVMVAALVALLLSGCGNGAGAPSSAGGDAAADSSAESAAPQPESAPESTEPPAQSALHENVPAPFSITSTAVVDGVLNDAYGKRGAQQQEGVPVLSPPIAFEDAPEGTVSYVLIMDDPDSEPVVGYVCDHWLIANIMDGTLAEDASRLAMPLSSHERTQGLNCFGITGYGGPTPPDAPHTYVFRAYALDTTLTLAPGYTRAALEEAMAGHVLAEATLEASYSN